MTEFDKGIKKLEIGAAILTRCHIEYLKSKGKIGSSTLEAVQEWETKELSKDKSEQSTLNIMMFEAYMLELVAKELKKEVERATHKERKMEHGCIQDKGNCTAGL